MNFSRTLFAVLACFISLPCAAQEKPATPTSPPAVNPKTEFARLTINGAVFIYKSPSQVDPCAPLPPNLTLLPLGTGFVVGVEDTEATDKQWHGWKFLVTAKHVVAGQDEVILRVNAISGSDFVCKNVPIHFSGLATNAISAPDGVDLVAISLPEISGADPTVVPSSFILNEETIKEWELGVGTQVAAVGYMYGYSGVKANIPVIKFGHIAAMSDDPWIYNPKTKLSERGYIVDLPNAPGLSGAPVYTYGLEFRTDPFRFRQLPPFVVGVVKDLILAPTDSGVVISQGVTVVEPASSLKALMKQVADALKAGGGKVK